MKIAVFPTPLPKRFAERAPWRWLRRAVLDLALRRQRRADAHLQRRPYHTMRSALIACLALLSAACALAQGSSDGRAYTRQELFVACLSGYVGASIARGETPDHDESLRLAAQILAKVHKFCPAPSPQLTEKNFTDPEAFLHRWMLMVTRELVVMARQGESQQMIGKW